MATFKNPIAPREKTNGKSPWSYKAPSKDGAHSGNIAAGDYYGTGFKNPVGKERYSSMSPVPMKDKKAPFPRSTA